MPKLLKKVCFFVPIFSKNTIEKLSWKTNFMPKHKITTIANESKLQQFNNKSTQITKKNK